MSLSLVVVLGFSQVDYITDERPQHEGLGVGVDVLFGQLEQSVAIWINSTKQSTATPGQGMWDKLYLYYHTHRFFTCT